MVVTGFETLLSPLRGFGAEKAVRRADRRGWSAPSPAAVTSRQMGVAGVPDDDVDRALILR
jgi:hypothetical protein